MTSALRGIALLAMPFALACHDVTAVAPSIKPVVVTGLEPAARCVVNVAARAMSCTSIEPAAPPSAPGVSADRIVGGQDVYVRLTSTGTFLSGENLHTNVTLQNLSQYAMGTLDGTTVAPISVFFHQAPAVTSGTGTVTLVNADGTGTFTSTNQQYYTYDKIVTPLEISASKEWIFHIDPGVLAFEFVVYVSAPMPSADALADRVWTGTTSTDWFANANWAGGAAPIATSFVAIPPDSLLGPGHVQPAVSTDVTVGNLRVGFGSTLNLGVNTITVTGNVDAPGTITNGTVRASSATAIIGGTLPAVDITGHARLQRATKTTGAVSIRVSGSLDIANLPLTIAVP